MRPTRPRVTLLLSAASVAAASVVLLAGGAPPARAAAAAGPAATELTAFPADGALALSGHGWGHGHGMSQWSAQGGAESGVSASAMLDAFYPATAATAEPPRTVHVLLTAADPGALTVWAVAGLTAGGASLPTGAAYSRWRLVPAGSALMLQSSPDGSSWAPYGGALPAGSAFADAAGLLRLALPGGGSRDYRGTLAASLVTGSTPTRVRTVDTLDLESYLRGVVPRESPSGWLPAALQVQAVAARSYATYEADHAPTGQAWDLCDSDACQVYGGATAYTGAGSATSLETPSTDSAVAATAGVVRTYGGSVIFAQFSSSSGGWSADGGFPYLNAHRDPWDGVDPGNANHSWRATLTRAEVAAAYPSLGTPTALEVTRRTGGGDFGGRVAQVVLHGVDAKGAPTAVTTSGYAIAALHPWPQAADGLRSEWFHVDGAVPVPAVAAVPVPAVAAVPRPSGLVATQPLVLTGAGGAVRAGSPHLTPVLPRSLPRGSTAVLLAVTATAAARGGGGAVAAWPGTARTQPGTAVQVVGVPVSGSATALALVPLDPSGVLRVGLTSGAAALRVEVVGVLAPAGLAAAASAPVTLPRIWVRPGVTTTVALRIPAGSRGALLTVLGSSAPGATRVKVAGADALSVAAHAEGTGTALVTGGRAGLTVVGAPVLVQLRVTPLVSASGAGLTVVPSRRAVLRSTPGHPASLPMPGAQQLVALATTAPVTSTVTVTGITGSLAARVSGRTSWLALLPSGGSLRVSSTRALSTTLTALARG